MHPLLLTTLILAPLILTAAAATVIYRKFRNWQLRRQTQGFSPNLQDEAEDEDQQGLVYVRGGSSTDGTVRVHGQGGGGGLGGGKAGGGGGGGIKGGQGTEEGGWFDVELGELQTRTRTKDITGGGSGGSGGFPPTHALPAVGLGSARNAGVRDWVGSWRDV